MIIVMRDERSTERHFFIIKDLAVFIGLNRKSEWRNRGLKINHSDREREKRNDDEERREWSKQD